MADGILNLSVIDVYGEPLREPVDVFFKNLTLAGDTPVIRLGKPAKSILIRNLNQAPQGQYRIQVDAPSYVPVSQFINIPSSKAGSLSVTLPVNKNRVTGVNFPEFSHLTGPAQRLLTETCLGSQSGPDLYSGWDPLRKAGFLNLAAKAQRTLLLNGKSVMDFLERITEQRGDRLFAIAGNSLHSEILHSVTDQLFHPVVDALHIPPPGFHLVDSFKTDDHYGNLQLTFSTDGVAWSVDMDIDDAQGFNHVFQVVRNQLTGQPTHPYNIHEILVKYQELDPGYTFNLGLAPLTQRVASSTA